MLLRSGTSDLSRRSIDGERRDELAQILLAYCSNRLGGGRLFGGQSHSICDGTVDEESGSRRIGSFDVLIAIQDGFVMGDGHFLRDLDAAGVNESLVRWEHSLGSSGVS